ncbi:putative Ig domain-containing protein [Leucobacter sp. cx-328]|uniref:Ig domain-containing protein n=1 Tax=unclassified Leucobacter TaxID=2621730 RepID=UPI00165DF936|nr:MULTISPECIES: Ig domain-containing protein [unclassified Leucobacter]MBC9945063.1 putative Ig domain-containing protein [Leucobacter sp. cx-328]
MTFRTAKLTALAATVGALFLGLASAPASATVSDEDTPLVLQLGTMGETQTYVISADGSTAYGFGDNQGQGQSTTIDLATRTVTGRNAPIDLEFYRSEIAKTRVAVGPYFAIYGNNSEYALIKLGTDDVQYFSDAQGNWPGLRHLVADETGHVTAIAGTGKFLSFDGSDFTEETRFRPEDTFPEGESGMSEDGMLYFESYRDTNHVDRVITVVVDMRTGETLGTVEGGIDNQFTPVMFDASGTSLWGRFADGPQTLANIDWQTGNPAFPSVELTEILPLNSTMYADGTNRWFVVGTTPMAAGDFSDETSFGMRVSDSFPINFSRVAATGDLIYQDYSSGQLGLVVGPKIAAPGSAAVTAFGQSVTFSAVAEGLAMSDPTEDPAGRVTSQTSTFGSIWQSSPDGVTWTDIKGADGPELNLTATEDSIALKYRRHFFDRFWGEQNSALAEMTTQGPKITRADDLPSVSAEKSYPAETITATGQAGMTWSSSDLPAGLAMNSSTGEITGTAPKAGEYTFTVTVTDIFGTDSKLFHLKATEPSVVPPVDPKPEPRPTPTPKPTPTPGSQQLANTGSGEWGPFAGLAFASVALGATSLLLNKRRSARAPQ